MEVAHQRYIDPLGVQPVPDHRDSPCGTLVVDRNADQLGAGPGQVRDLSGCRLNISRVRIGHGLDHDRRATTDNDVIYGHAEGIAALNG